MAGSTNFQQWNPGQANQETDAQYAADSQRTGGAPNGTPFPSETANKLYYQVSTGITALMQMMAAKGFTVDDSNIGTLASVLAAIQTTADLKNQMQNVAYSPALTLNAAAFNGFQIALSGNTTLTITGASAGQLIFLEFQNDSAGNHTVTFPSNWFGSWQPDPTGGVASTILVGVDTAGNFKPLGPMMSNSGINNVPIGQTARQPGSFTTLIAALTTLTGLTVNGNSTINGNETVSGSFSAAAATLASLIVSGAATLNGGTLNGSYNGNPDFLGTLTAAAAILAGGTLNGTYGGNPTFSGTVATNVATTNTPGVGDNSTRVPNTSWIQNLLGSFLSSAGFRSSIAANGWILFPTSLGGLMIQWGLSPDPNGGTITFNLPTTFPNNAFMMSLTNHRASGGDNREVSVISLSTSQATITNDGSSEGCYFIAIGN